MRVLGDFEGDGSDAGDDFVRGEGVAGALLGAVVRGGGASVRLTGRLLMTFCGLVV